MTHKKKTFLQVNLHDLSLKKLDMSYAFKPISILGKTKYIRGVLRPYICQINYVSMAHCKLVSKIKLHLP